MESASSASRLWKTYPQLSKEEFQAARNVDIDPLYAQLLTNRGITDLDEMRVFLHADYDDMLNPNTLIDMSKAVTRIQEALSKGERVVVYGDYDADGVTSSALLYRALRSLIAYTSSKSPLDFHIPHRLNDGCGLNIAALDEIHKQGTQLIVTTDCASSDVEQVTYANSLGIDVIVTDHHHPPTELPSVYAMVNPWRNDVPAKNEAARVLCGAGVAFKLVQALYLAYEHSLQECRTLLDLAAIGTIGDIAPLLGENHILVRLGMEQLNNTSNSGLKALIRKGMLQPGRIRERDVAYGLTPRINAAGRMDKASIAFNLLTTESETEAEQYVEQLEQLNRERQTQTEELMQLVREEAEKHPDDQVVVVSGHDWHEGILGLVAGRLVEEIHKPVFVLNNDRETQLSRGSARSQKGFNIIAALKGFAASLERYGGHVQAAGFTIRTDRIDTLRDYLLSWDGEEEETIIEVVEEGGTTEPVLDMAQVEQATNDASAMNAVSNANDPRPEKMADLILTRTDLLSYDGYKKIRQLAPFGAANPEPTFIMEHVRLLDKWTSGMNRQNLRLKLGIPSKDNASWMTVMGTWSKEAAREPEFDKNSYVDVVFRIESSEDESRRDVWLKILDVRKVI